MYKLVLMILVLTVGCSTKPSYRNVNKNMASYKLEAQKVIALAKNNGSKEEINQRTKKLIDIAQVILTNYKKRHPECSKIVNIMINSSTKMTQMSLSQIETDFHDGNALPEAPDVCFDPKELLVHPATVAIITRVKFNNEGRDQIVDELEEVLNHADNIDL